MSTLLLKETLIQTLGSSFEKKSYLIGVSGGIDSVSLLHAACGVVPPKNLTVLHFNHLTRGQESDDDEAFVRELGSHYDLDVIVEKRKEQSVSEASLRKERFEFFRKEARRLNAYVLLGHHLDDQLETFLFRLIRGTQLKGLMGMRLKNGRIIRPLLSIPKNTILSYAERYKLDCREDSSNRENTYFRNKIRHDLTPLFVTLTESYGGIKSFYERFNRLVLESQKTLCELDREFDAYLKARLVRTIFFDRLDLRALPEGWQNSGNFVRRLFETLDLKQIHRTSIESTLDLLTRKKRRVSLLGGFAAEVSCEFLYFQSVKQQERWKKGIVFQREKSLLTASLIGFELKGVEPGSLYRTFCPGDRYQTRKLKEEFLKRGIPRLERRLIPLLVDTNTREVLWFLGQSDHQLKGAQSSFPFAIDLFSPT